LLSLKPTLTFRRWKKTLDASGQLPAPEEVRQTRKWVMWQGHVVPVIAVVAIFWARGMGATPCCRRATACGAARFGRT
jgi:putative membrane protein